jgi:uncharacterized membrane protein YdjX (TVP38/TMEM64 family)
VSDRVRWTLGSVILTVVLGVTLWLVLTDAPIVGLLSRAHRDNALLKETVASWGWAAPLIFIAIQVVQVIMSPIPGEMTGPVGGALFGTFSGALYSTIGLTLGTLLCFGIGRLYGEPLVRRWLSERHWRRMNFVLEAEGAILCFILYLIPGFPKDLLSYLFGISPIPFWVFALVSTLGRIPGTWISSYVGAHVVEHQYISVVSVVRVLAIVVAISLPLYYYRDRILEFFHGLGRGRAHKPNESQSRRVS